VSEVEKQIPRFARDNSVFLREAVLGAKKLPKPFETSETPDTSETCFHGVAEAAPTIRLVFAS
jgi:hypothetical protein